MNFQHKAKWRGWREAQWEHTAAVAAAALSAMSEEPIHPWTLNPYAPEPETGRRGGLSLTADNIDVLKEWLD